MFVKVVEKHDGEGTFPTFTTGTQVNLIEKCAFYLNWSKCVINGCETYVPDSYVKDGLLIVDYNPTELICDLDDTIEVKQIVFAWIYGKKGKVEGWIPSYKCLSV